MEHVCNVTHNGRHPILMLRRKGADYAPGLPRGPVAMLINGKVHLAYVAKIAINVVRESPDGVNILPAILRGWFDLEAGQTGRHDKVKLRQVGRQWIMEPVTNGNAREAA